MKKTMISLVITLILGFIFYYFVLPPINIQSLLFWVFVVFNIGVFVLSYLIAHTTIRGQFNGNQKVLITCVGFVIGLFVIIPITNIICSPIFNSSSYASRIEVKTDSVFSEDIKEIDFNNIPLLDKASSQKLGDRVMGQMPEMVSQYLVSDLYTQINYNDKIIRVTPLEYNGFFKYMKNHEEGVIGYITVNSVTGESELVKLEKGMKYLDSAIFSEDLSRKLRFTYPTEIFGEKTFEIDNEGNPYWIIPTLKYIGVGLKTEVDEVIILDPITGKSTKYSVDEVPTWVDHVYSADLLIEQVDDWGLYKEGFLNSLFSQTNVVMTTTGYNYTVMNDDVYLYTGITSVASDEANVGFILVNMRTKEAYYYAVPGAEENSAMASAEGQVQQMNYTATFPLLINLNGKATYLISLKDDAGLVKMYAFVDLADYQKVIVTDASKGITVAASNYLAEYADEVVVDEDTYITKSITVTKITQAITDNKTYYYIVDENNNKYKVSIDKSDLLPFIEVGNVINISYLIETNITEIIKIG